LSSDRTVSFPSIVHRLCIDHAVIAQQLRSCASIAQQISRSRGQRLRFTKALCLTLMNPFHFFTTPLPFITKSLINLHHTTSTTLTPTPTLIQHQHNTTSTTPKQPDGNINEAEHQIAFSDRIILNKLDLVSEEEVEEITERIQVT
jgi:hypothetical protein